MLPNRRSTVPVAALALLAALAVVYTAGAATRSPVVATKTTKLGRILVDAHGRTLYLFGADKNGKSVCGGKCATFWPPLIATGKPRAGAGTRPSLLGTIKRANGQLQVTYNHHPLYAFVNDTKAGQVNGEGVKAFGAIWYAVSPAGTNVEKPTSGSGGGNSYP
jgi:predicted lipoprotein with Yx(FWY)xxD motif